MQLFVINSKKKHQSMLILHRVEMITSLSRAIANTRTDTDISDLTYLALSQNIMRLLSCNKQLSTLFACMLILFHIVAGRISILTMSAI